MAKRSLSQNFLVDQNIIDKIIASAGLCPNDAILEIGPGQGALTAKMAPLANRLIAIETDSSLIPLLEPIKGSSIIHADFLAFDLETLCPFKPLKVISNLPYHITSKILKKLALHKELFSSWTVMVQKEFAEKLRSPMQGPLFYFLHYHYQIKSLFSVSKGCFNPRPSIDSTVISLIPNEEALDPLFFDFLTHIFEHRRKVLHKTLNRYYSEENVAKAFEMLNLPLSIRTEELAFKSVHALYELLAKGAL